MPGALLLGFHDEDRKTFRSRLGEACAKTGWRAHAYVLMGNHHDPFLSLEFTCPPLNGGPQTDHGRPMKTNYFKIRADAPLALVVAEAMEKTGLGQSDVLRLGSLRGVPEITSALAGGTALPRLPEGELRRHSPSPAFHSRRADSFSICSNDLPLVSGT
jgi:hypothetical protein